MVDFKILLGLLCLVFAYNLDATVAPTHITATTNASRTTTHHTTKHHHGSHTHRPTREPNENDLLEMRYDHQSNLFSAKIGKTCYLYHLYGDDVRRVHTSDGIREIEIHVLQLAAAKPNTTFPRDDLFLMSLTLNSFCPESKNTTLIKLN